MVHRALRFAWSKHPVVGFGLIVLSVLALTTPGFASTPSLYALVNTAAFVGCIAVGMTFITLSGNFLSFALGAAAGLSAITCAWLSQFGLAIAMLAAIVLSTAINALQGFIIGF